MLSRGAAHLASRLKSKVSREVTYKRKANSATLSATAARTVWETTSELERVNISNELQDFIVNTADLVWSDSSPDSGEAFRPEKLDKIVEVDTTTGRTFTYQVLPGPSGDFWEYQGTERTRVRIHTKRLSEVET